MVSVSFSCAISSFSIAVAEVPAFSAGVVRPILGAACEAGYAREDFSALGKVVRALAGLG